MKKFSIFIAIFAMLAMATASYIAGTKSDTKTRIYPYFGKGNGSFINVIVITNISETVGSADLTLYETDGDVFTATVAVAAHGMYVSLLNSIVWTPTGSSAVMGDSRGYVMVSANFTLNGVAMITNPITGESISYIPQ